VQNYVIITRKGKPICSENLRCVFAPIPYFCKNMFTILIPTWNNLPYLKICIESITRHSTFRHQVVVHVNDGKDGTLEWVKENGIEFTHSPSNIGICKALNLAASLAKTKYICYFNDDMFALPGWDYFLAKDIEGIRHENFFVSSTMIEPKDGKDANIIQGMDFGDLHNFKEKELIKASKDFAMADWYGASWPPNVVPKKLWDKVGGYSEEFSPGMYSDPDFSMKLWKEGVRYFKGIGESKVYHFMSKSTEKVVKNDGRKTFIEKWGISPGYFYRSMLKMGKKWQGELVEPAHGLAYSLMKLKIAFKRLITQKT
jgi:glycosyltransferase involved in cell wall biosynthesis